MPGTLCATLRKRGFIRHAATWLLALSVGAPGAAARAQDDPARPLGSAPIKIVIPFGAGSGTDFYGRLVAQQLTESLGTSVIIENRPGANGVIAAEQVANAKPDGTTFFMTSNTAVAANPHLIKNLRYDPVRDFTPISRMGNLTFFVMVAADSPFRNMKDLLDTARRDPRKVSYGTANSLSLVSGVKLANLAGVEILQVPYKNPPQIVTDLLGGQLSFAFVDMATASSLTKTGKVRAIATLGENRFPLLPDVPSMKELGFPEFDVVAWFGLFAPAGTPAPVVSAMNKALNAVLAKPDFRERTAAAGFEAFGSTPEGLAAYLKEQLALWGKLTADAGLQPQ